MSSFKAVIDGLVGHGILENDKISNIGQPTYAQEKGPRGKGFITIKVEEL